MTDTVTVSDRPAQPVRQLLAASVGNAVEWYDWFSCTGALEAYSHAPDLQGCWPKGIFENAPPLQVSPSLTVYDSLDADHLLTLLMGRQVSGQLTPPRRFPSPAPVRQHSQRT
ncbi:hypothetical protein ACFVDU_17515 [Streptomyces albidoflavus]